MSFSNFFLGFCLLVALPKIEGSTFLLGPGNQYAVLGGDAVFAVTHALEGAVTYQWQLSTDGGNNFEDFADSAVFSGSQSSELSISNVQSYLLGTLYRVVVDASGTLYTSEAGELLQAFLPFFTQQPARSFDSEGVLIAAAVVGPPEPGLNWQVSEDAGETWTHLTESARYVGITSASFRITAYDASMASYRYRLKASNLAGEVLSDAVVLGTIPAFTQQPNPISCAEGDEVSFSVAANGFPEPVIRWEVSGDNGNTWTELRNDSVYGGVDTTTLRINSTWELDALRYRAMAVNAVGELASNVSILSVSHAPRIVSAPVKTRLFAGRETQFLAQVSANPSATYEWQVSFDGSLFFNLLPDAVYSGVNGAELRIVGATLEMDGYLYRLRATNSLGMAASTAVPLTVRHLQNFEGWLAAKSIPEGEREVDTRHGPLQLSNREAYVFGLDPFEATVDDLPHLVGAGNVITFFYRLNRDVEDAAVFFESSVDLNAWEETEPSEESVLWYADGVEGREAVFDWNGTKATFIRINAGFLSDLVFVRGGTLAMSMGTATVDTFWIGKHEVTWNEWQTVQTYASANGYDIDNIGAGCALDHPVHSVSWYDVVKWCNAKSEMDGLIPVYRVNGEVYRSGENSNVAQDLALTGYRLPLETEWEFAARGGNHSKGYTYAGGDDLSLVGWSWEYAGRAACGLSLQRGTWPVGKKLANELGIYDMSGNVLEWCWDRDTSNSNYRLLRGGSWYFSESASTVSYRMGSSPNTRDDRLGGFRLARSSGN